MHGVLLMKKYNSPRILSFATGRVPQLFIKSNKKLNAIHYFSGKPPQVRTKEYDARFLSGKDDLAANFLLGKITFYCRGLQAKPPSFIFPAFVIKFSERRNGGDGHAKSEPHSIPA